MAENFVDQRRFARVRATDYCNLQGFCHCGAVREGVSLQFGFVFGDIQINKRRVSFGTFGERLRHRAQQVIKIIKAFTVFGGKPQRLAQTQRPRIQSTCVGSRSFGLVYAQNNPRAFAAQDIGKHQIVGGDTGAPVDQEQADIGHINGALGQAAHTSLQTVISDVFQARRINHGETQIEQFGIAFAQIARHTGLIIDQRQFSPHEAVEKRGFAHIRAAYYGQGKRHLSLRRVVKRLPYTQPRLTESVKLAVARNDVENTAGQSRLGSSPTRNIGG